MLFVLGALYGNMGRYGTGEGCFVRLYERVSACEETAVARADDGYDGMFGWWGDGGANS